MRNRKRIAILIILIPAVLLLSSIPVKAAAPFLDLVAQAALLAEVDTGTVLFGHNTNVRHPADSLAKVMTMILAVSAIEDGEAGLNDLVIMTESALFDIKSSSSTQGISPGEEMTLVDLMYCAFVGGANEACNLIAEHIAGSVETFVDMMNERAKELGCERTNFTNPHGQYNDDQYTTAMDQFAIYRDALGHPLFEDLSGTFRYTIEETNKSKQRRLTGTNSLLNTGGKYFFRPCTSGLASITYEGGHSFVGFAESDGLSLIVVVLGSDVVMFEDNSAEMRNLTEAARLFEWGFSEFAWRIILSPSAPPIGKAPVEHGAGADYVNLRPESEIKRLLDKDIPDKDFKHDVVIYSDRDGEPLVAPVTAGQVLGEVTVTRYDAKTRTTIEYGTIRLVANTSVELHRLQFIKMQITEVLASSTAHTVIWILVILIAGYLALVIRYNVVRIKRIRKIKEAKRKLIEERQHEPEPDFDEFRRR